MLCACGDFNGLREYPDTACDPERDSEVEMAPLGATGKWEALDGSGDTLCFDTEGQLRRIGASYVGCHPHGRGLVPGFLQYPAHTNYEGGSTGERLENWDIGPGYAELQWKWAYDVTRVDEGQLYGIRLELQADTLRYWYIDSYADGFPKGTPPPEEPPQEYRAAGPCSP